MGNVKNRMKKILLTFWLLNFQQNLKLKKTPSKWGLINPLGNALIDLNVDKQSYGDRMGNVGFQTVTLWRDIHFVMLLGLFFYSKLHQIGTSVKTEPRMGSYNDISLLIQDGGFGGRKNEEDLKGERRKVILW